MPTIVTGGRQRQPSGLDKFLNTLQGITGAATGVANIITLPKRLRIEQERADIAGREIDIREGQLDLAETQNEQELAQQRLGQTVLNTFNSRNGLFDLAEAGQLPLDVLNGPVDPALRGAAVSLGDVPFSQREQARRDIAIMRGQDISEVNDAFILSEENLQFVLDRSAQESDIAALSDVEGTEALQDARRAQAATGVAGSTTADAIRNKRLDEALNNELFRIDPTQSGSAITSGAAYGSPGELDRIAREVNGLPPRMLEFDLNGERVFVTPDVYDDMMKAMMDQVLLLERDSVETVNNAAETMVESIGGGMDLPTALLIVQGRFDELSPEAQADWAPLIEGAKEQAKAAVSTLLNNPLIMQLDQTIQRVKDLGFPDSEAAEAVEIFQAAFSTMFPESGIITIRDLGFWESIRGGPVEVNIPGATDQEIIPSMVTGGEAVTSGAGSPGRRVGLPGSAGNPLPPPPDEVAAADLSAALSEALLPKLVQIVGESPGAQAIFFEDLAENGFTDDTGLTRPIPPAAIAAMKEQLLQLQALQEQGN